MVSTVRTVTVDCADPYALGSFWAQVFDRPLADDDAPGDPEALLRTGGVDLLYVRVPDAKTVKNRVHLDLQPEDRSRDAEVERLTGLGALVVADLRKPDGAGWVVLADPEGNEFCVLRSAAERAAADV